MNNEAEALTAFLSTASYDDIIQLHGALFHYGRRDNFREEIRLHLAFTEKMAAGELTIADKENFMRESRLKDTARRDWLRTLIDHVSPLVDRARIKEKMAKPDEGDANA